MSTTGSHLPSAWANGGTLLVPHRRGARFGQQVHAGRVVQLQVFLGGVPVATPDAEYGRVAGSMAARLEHRARLATCIQPARPWCRTLSRRPRSRTGHWVRVGRLSFRARRHRATLERHARAEDRPLPQEPASQTSEAALVPIDGLWPARPRSHGQRVHLLRDLRQVLGGHQQTDASGAGGTASPVALTEPPTTERNRGARCAQGGAVSVTRSPGRTPPCPS